MYHTINSANKYFRKSSFLNLTPASQSHLQLACLVVIIDIHIHSTESGSGLSFCLNPVSHMLRSAMVGIRSKIPGCK